MEHEVQDHPTPTAEEEEEGKRLESMLQGIDCALPVEQPIELPKTLKEHTLPIRLMSFNLRFSTTGDGEHYWGFRRQIALATIKRENPDVLAVQEALPAQLAYLADNLPEYRFTGRPRDNGKDKGEHAAVFFRSSRFSLTSAGTFWLSPTPQKPGSVGFGNKQTRICSWQTLSHQHAAQGQMGVLAQGQAKLKAVAGSLKDHQVSEAVPNAPNTIPTFMVVNVHLDHKHAGSRVKAMQLIQEHVRSAALPFVILGDFNATESDGAVKHAITEMNALHCYRAANGPPCSPCVEKTCHFFNGHQKGHAIDHILVSRDFEVSACKIVHASKGQALVVTKDRPMPHRMTLWASDHFPIVSDVLLTVHGAPLAAFRLTKGFDVQCYGAKKGVLHPRVLFLSYDGCCLMWCTKSERPPADGEAKAQQTGDVRTIRLEGITELRRWGDQAVVRDGWKHATGDSTRSFTIVGKERELDIMMPSVADMEKLIAIVQRVISKH